MELVKDDDPILRKPCDKFDFINPPFDPIEFSKNLVKHMYDWNGIGLAANQVGVPYSIFAMRGAPENFVCFNPKIVQPSEQTILLEEGCLSYPGLLVKVKRPIWIKVRFNYPNGQAGTHRFEGMTARCFLHEYDHIEFGHTFIDSANFLHKEKAERQWKKLQRLRNG